MKLSYFGNNSLTQSVSQSESFEGFYSSSTKRTISVFEQQRWSRVEEECWRTKKPSRITHEHNHMYRLQLKSDTIRPHPLIVLPSIQLIFPAPARASPPPPLLGSRSCIFAIQVLGVVVALSGHWFEHKFDEKKHQQQQDLHHHHLRVGCRRTIYCKWIKF